MTISIVLTLTVVTRLSKSITATGIAALEDSANNIDQMDILSNCSVRRYLRRQGKNQLLLYIESENSFAFVAARFACRIFASIAYVYVPETENY